MTTPRRLSDEDVRAIFESLHGNQTPPSHLKFRIVPVGASGLRLSPPSYQFEDGIYVLLRPEKKNRGSSDVDAFSKNWSKIPNHLKHMAIEELPPMTCPWSLSGPQFPQPTAIQQRYCYPRGDPEFSGRKGAALWTMYERDGKENMEFRLLHVYFSAKRAVNKGVALSEEDQVTKKRQDAVGTPKKKPMRLARSLPSPWQKDLDIPTNDAPPRKRRRHGASTSSPEPPIVDRLSILPPPSRYHTSSGHIGRQRGSIFVSPSSEFGARSSDHSMFDHPPFHPVPSFDMDENTKPATAKTKDRYPFRYSPPTQECQRLRGSGPLAECDETFVFNETHVTALGNNNGTLEIAYWDDPLFALNNKPSFDESDVLESTSPAADHASASPTADPNLSSRDALKVRLAALHERIRIGIASHPPSQQGELLSVVASWAREVASSPLGSTNSTMKKPHQINKMASGMGNSPIAVLSSSTTAAV